jgi:sugar diacid utilization regulator
MAQRMNAPLGAVDIGAVPPFDGPDSRAAELVERLRTIHLEMVDAVTGGDDLERVAEIAGRAIGSDVAIVAPRLGPPAVSAPEVAEGKVSALTRYVADRLSDRPVRVPESVIREVPIKAGDELVGLVALLSPPTAASMPEPTEVLHLAAAATLTKLAIEEARHTVEEDLRDAFMEELRSQGPLGAADIVRRAVRFGCDVTRGAVVLCVDGDPSRPRRTMATIAGEVPGALTQSLDGRVYAVLPAVQAPDPAEPTLALAEATAARLRRHGTVGISSFYRDPGELRRALQEAELMVDVLRESGAPTPQVAGAGAYRLLMRLFVTHPEDVWSFYESTVGAIVRYDERCGTDLVPTLESYLAHNCNMNATAAAVFAHRHTIAYRLDRMRELSGLDPAQGEHRERLGLGLKAYRILAPRVHARTMPAPGPARTATRGGRRGGAAVPRSSAGTRGGPAGSHVGHTSSG